jgi:hypothetical protein
MRKLYVVIVNLAKSFNSPLLFKITRIGCTVPYKKIRTAIFFQKAPYPILRGTVFVF